MSLDLYTGILVEPPADEDRDFHTFYAGLFSEIEAALIERELPAHHEPGPVEGSTVMHWGIKAGLQPFRSVVEKLSEEGEYDYSHVAECSNYSTVFVPVKIPELFSLGETVVASSIELAKVSCVAAVALGMSDDELVGKVLSLLGEDPAVEAEMKRAEALRSGLIEAWADEDFVRLAADCCSKMLNSVQRSITAGVSVVIVG